MITVKPYGGLANRMRVLDSVLLIVKNNNVPVKIIWEKSFELNCPFYHLFQAIPNTILQEHNSGPLMKRTKEFMMKRLRQAGIMLPMGFDARFFDETVEKLKKQAYDFAGIIQYGAVYVNTVHRFYSQGNLLADFKPVQELQEVIDNMCKDFGHHTIGIHIRRNDNLQSIRYSPLEGFISAMAKEIEDQQDTRFFLATDSGETEKLLVERFGKRIITRKKVLSRNSEKGIQDALIDLYCLANTSKIIGSFYSSFSEVAAEIHKIKLMHVFIDQAK